MESFFSSSFWFGEETLNSVHLFIGGWFDYFMIAVTSLGNEMFYTLLLPVLYWSGDRRKGVKIGIVFLLSAALNDIAKEIFQNPRPNPELLLDGIKNLSLKYSPKGPGFPSGHTQCTISFFGPIFLLFKRKYIRIICVFAIILVPYSRMYLGVHYAGDILGGFILGGLSLLLIPILVYPEKNIDKFKEFGLSVCLIILPVMFFSLTPNHEVNKTAGVLSGFLIGAILSRGRIDFNPSAGPAAAVIKSAAGLLVMFAIKEGVKPLLPGNEISGFFRYWLMGFWVAFIAPSFFSRFRFLKGKSA